MALLVVAAVLAVVSLTGGGDEGADRLGAAPDVPMVSVPSGEPTAEPTTAPTAGATTDPDDDVTAGPTSPAEGNAPSRPASSRPSAGSTGPRTSATPSCTNKGRYDDNCPDGKPGWTEGLLRGCFVNEAPKRTPVRSASLGDDLTVVMELPDSVTAGQEVVATVRVTNTGASAMRLSQIDTYELALTGGGYAAGRYDDVNYPWFAEARTLAPGASTTYTARGPSTGCADTSRDAVARPALAPGGHTAAWPLRMSATPVGDATASASPTATPTATAPTPDPRTVTVDVLLGGTVRLT